MGVDARADRTHSWWVDVVAAGGVRGAGGLLAGEESSFCDDASSKGLRQNSKESSSPVMMMMMGRESWGPPRIIRNAMLRSYFLRIMQQQGQVGSILSTTYVLQLQCRCLLYYASMPVQRPLLNIHKMARKALKKVCVAFKI